MINYLLMFLAVSRIPNFSFVLRGVISNLAVDIQMRNKSVYVPLI